MAEEIVAVRLGVKLGDIRFSMTAYGVARDIDIVAKRDVYRFATSDLDYVEISVPWYTPLSRQLALVAEQFKVKMDG